MAWGDDDVIVSPAPARSGRQAPARQASASAAAGWGDDDVVVKPARGAGVGAPAASTPKPRPKLKASQSLGFYKGALTPVDNLAVWTEAAARKVPGVGAFGDKATDVLNDFTEDRLHAGRWLAESAGEARQSHRDFVKRQADRGYKPGVGGQVAGSILTGLPIAAILRNPALVGGVQGALETGEDENALQNTILGAVGGHYGDRIVRGVGNAIAPAIAPAVRRLDQLGVRLTQGQIKGGRALAKESRQLNQPVVGPMIEARRQLGLQDWNRGVTNRMLLPIGQQVPDHIETGGDAIDFAQRAVSDAYNRVMPQVTLRADPRMAVGIRNAWRDISDREAQAKFLDVLQDKLDFSAVGPATRRQGRADLRSTLDSGGPGFRGNTMTPQRAAVALRDIRKAAADYTGGSNQSDRAVGQALWDVDNVLQNLLERQNPHVAQELRNANRAYRGVQLLNRAGAGADESLFSTERFKTAVKALDRTKNKAATAANRAFGQDLSRDARAVLPNTQPNPSGTGRAVLAASPAQHLLGQGRALAWRANNALSQAMLEPRGPFGTGLGELLRNLAPYAAPGAAGYTGARWDEDQED